MTYTPPLRELTFALKEIAGAGRLQQLGAYSGFDDEILTAVLDAGGKLARNVLAPLNRIGDEKGASFENGRVRAAPGFGDAYRAFQEGGWSALAANPEYGGQGLPKALEIAVYEMMHSANMAFGLCPILSQGAIEAIAAHGSDRQKQRYLPKLVSGEWTGTMNLTEPQAGSDLAALRTRAEPDGNGGYRLTGQKIFITWGDHDMADNIVHLVLARLPGAPDGTKGVSLFLASRQLVRDDGTPGAANELGPISIEHKLGIHASPTCVMEYRGAQAELVGVENQGLAHMFTMMNAARLQVGTQGVAIAERAYQQALAFSLDRRQGRSAWTGEYPAPIFDHPDIRRALLLMKARIEAARGICLSTAVAGDLARALPEGGEREAAKLREEFLTPIAKAWSTDMGVEIASEALQVHGGMGFIEETGAAQHYRDSRIAPIYEGTNGIQAIDLIGRKLSLGNGQAARELMNEITRTCDDIERSSYAALASVSSRLRTSLVSIQGTTDWLIERRGKPDALSGATAYLKLMGDVVGGWMLAKGALAATQHLTDDADQWWRTRIALARVYSENVLARAPGLTAAIMMGQDDLVGLTPQALGHSE